MAWGLCRDYDRTGGFREGVRAWFHNEEGTRGMTGDSSPYSGLALDNSGEENFGKLYKTIVNNLVNQWLNEKNKIV